MFGKLLKYEFKSISKWYLGLLVVTTLIAILTGNQLKSLITSAVENSSSYDIAYSTGQALSSSDIMMILSLIILAGLIMTLTLASYAIIIRRFYQSVFSRQGYLTMTLPVSTHHIILSKLLVAFLLYIATYCIFAIVIFAFVIPVSGWSTFSAMLQSFYSEVITQVTPFWTTVFHVNAILTNVSAVLLIYLAIALGQLSNNYRVLMGFVSYGGLFILTTLIGLLLSSQLTGTSLLMANLITTIMIIIVAYIATHTIIRYKLNLE
ncbi:hypothetical protein [Streptococcus plurextorum]|uniref:hypothetical protein n=1 Tax=Streptococcus plurextorum TaxID=456876 RepID=UPI0004227DC9|nr:hypothetical protein [Streptococcus plurextorum]